MSVHSEAWNECSLECTSLILAGLQDPSDSVIGQLHCNNSAVGTTEVKVVLNKKRCTLCATDPDFKVLRPLVFAKSQAIFAKIISYVY